MILPALGPETWGPAIDEAVNAVQRGAIIVLPTDTVYGVGCDAFNPGAVLAVLVAKGRGKAMPPPVLIPDDGRTVGALAREVPPAAAMLMDEFWPGALTIICEAQPSLAWDLGETGGTVALRVPNHPVALALLARTGPMAVTSANRTGKPPAQTADDAKEQLGDSVAVYLDGGPAPLGEASTIVDATGPLLRVVRDGGISRAELERVAGEDAFEPRGEASA